MQLLYPKIWLDALRGWRRGLHLHGGGWIAKFKGGPCDVVRMRRLAVELQERLSVLHVRSPQLKLRSSELEAAFMRVGKGLEQLANESTVLFEKCDTVGATKARQDMAALIQPVVQLLNRPLNFLSSCEGEMRGVMEMMFRADSQIEGVLTAGQEVSRKMEPFTFMQVLFRVESARLPADLQQMFVALTEDIQRLHAQMLETFTARLEAVRGSRTTIQDGIGRLELILAEHSETTLSQRTCATQTIESVEAELSEHRALEEDIAALTRSVAQQVGQIVIGLQSQDIISQRLTHVVEAIGRLIEVHESQPWDLASEGSLAQFALFTLMEARLQGEHLKEIAEEATNSEKRIQSGLASILESIRKLNEVTGITRATSRTSELSSMVEVLRGPISETQRRADAVCDLIGPLGGQAADLTSIIKELADSIWLGGLNAQVQSAKVAMGTGLEVLSAQICMIAKETRSAASEISSKVDSLVQEFNGIVSRLGALKDSSHEHNESLTKEGAQHVLLLANLSTENRQFKVEVSALAGSISAHIAELQAMVCFTNGFCASVDGIIKVLNEIFESASALVDFIGVTDLAPEWQQKLVGHYSMASEVDAHQRTLGVSVSKSKDSDGVKANSGSAVNHKPAGGELVVDRIPVDTLNENCTGVASGTVAGSVAVSHVSELGSNVELF